MSDNIKETENSSSSLKEIKLSQISQDISNQNNYKIKKKFYCLYKKGKKLVVKKKEKDNNNNMKEIKNEENIKINYLENKIYNNFKTKYNNMPDKYNSIIITRLMHSINSNIVAAFKEYLIYGDIYEFLTKYYNIKRSPSLLKDIIDFYIANNIIFPNYVILPEGNYIYRNIQQKQRIIDNQEENLKNKNKNKEKTNKEENILTSKVMDSILNQTDTSEARNCFGLNNNSINDIDDDNINLLIENIGKAEDINNKNQIFQKKKLIRIMNKEIGKKKNNILAIYKPINKRNIDLTNKNKNEKYINDNEINDTDKNNNYSSIKKSIEKDLMPNLPLYKNNNNNFENIKMNTIKDKAYHPKKKYLFNDFREDSNNSKNSNDSLHVLKRPIKQNYSYNKSKIYNNLSKKNIYLKAYNSKFNSSNHLDFSQPKNKLNIDDENGPIVYKKKFNKILRKKNTDLNIEKTIKRKIINFDDKINKNLNSKSNDKNYGNLMMTKNLNKYIINTTSKNDKNNNDINFNNDKPLIYNKILNKKLAISNYRTSLSNNKLNNKKTITYSNHTFKSIAKMIKRKYIIDEDELSNNTNLINNFTQSRNRIIYNAPLTTRNYEYEYKKNKEILNNNNNSKNIYISNNITNNNYYTIENNSRINDNFIKRYSKKTEINKGRINKLINLKNYDNKKENIYLNTEPNISSSINHKENKIINSKTINSMMSPYKNGLIKNTTIKNLDKYSVKYFLNKFNEKNYSNEKNEYKMKYNINTNNYQNNNNQYKTINVQSDLKSENKIKLKKRYLILRDGKNMVNIRNNKRNNLINKIDINSKNRLLKTIDLNHINKIKTFSSSTKNNNRNNKINYYN